MKRLFAALLCAGLLAVSMTGCSYQDALAQNSESSQVEETKSASDDEADADKDVNPASYDNNLDGLCEYFAALGYIPTNKKGEIDTSKEKEMDAALIGAKSGKKYQEKALAVELYEYDTEKLNDTAKEIIASVEKDGTFTILDMKPVKAYLSDNGKYLMVYTDSGISEDKENDRSKLRDQVVEDFKVFHK